MPNLLTAIAATLTLCALTTRAWIHDHPRP
jgi:hypothetical protein